MGVFIYALLDDGEIFYVGKTVNMRERFKNHVSQSVRLWNEKDKRIQDILLNGRKLEYRILDDVDHVIGDKAEADTIRTLIQGGTPLLNCMLYKITRKNQEIIAGLNRTQRQVLVWLSEDKTSEEVGRLMGKSPRTVETIRQKIKKVANVKTNPGLMIWAVKQGLVAV